jgi:Flp pilus assembly protein TadG
MSGQAKIRQARQRSGSTMVEFALTLPLLALLLFGIIQYGFIFAAYMTIRNASVVGARYATLGTSPSVTQIQDITRGACATMLGTNASNPTVTVTPNVTVGSVSGATQVQVQYNLKLIVPFVVPGKTGGSSLSLSATSVMR